MNRLGIKFNALLGVILLLGVFANLNYLSFSYLSTARADLTLDHRWTLSPVTLEVLAGMQKRFEETVGIEEAGKGAALTPAERNGLRVRLDLYISADPPPQNIDSFRDTENRLRDIRAAAGDFLLYRVHSLDPERTRIEIEEAEEHGVQSMRSQDDLGRQRNLYCGLVLRYADRKEVLGMATWPVDVEAWLVRQIDAFRETAEPALVCVLGPRELRKAPMARPGIEALREFMLDLNNWIGQQSFATQQERNQKYQQLIKQFQPDVLGKDLRYLLGRAATVKLLDRIDTYSPLPEGCDLLILMQPEASTMSTAAVGEIARYLRGGGTVIALAPRYRWKTLNDPQGEEIDLGELGHYLDGCGVRIREEIVAQIPCVRVSQNSQQRQANTVGRRDARSQRLPFFPRLDLPAERARAKGHALELALVRGQHRALEEMVSFEAGLEGEGQELIATILGDLRDSLGRWSEVSRAERDHLSPIEGEQGTWPIQEVVQRLRDVRKRIAAREKTLDQAEEELHSSQIYRQDIEAQLQQRSGARAELESQLEQTRTQIASKRAEIDRLRRAIDDCNALQRGMNFLRKAYGIWRERLELGSAGGERDRLSRRAYVRQLESLRGQLEAGEAPGAEARDALDTWLLSFDLLYSFDEYLGGPRAVVAELVGILERSPSDAAARSDGYLNQLLGPRSLVDGLKNVFLLWTHALELDPKRVQVVAGDAPEQALAADALRATVVARSAPTARYVRRPAPLGALDYYRRHQSLMRQASTEAAMFLEAMNPEKRSEDLEGSQPLLVLLEGRFPPYEKGLQGRPFLDALRAITSQPWLGGPLSLAGDEKAPVFDPQAGWQGGGGLSAWSLADLAAAARELQTAATPPGEQSTAEAAARPEQGEQQKRPGRMIVLPDLYFAIGGQNISIVLNQLASEGREYSSPLLRRILDWALHGGDAKYVSFDERQLARQRRLKSFKEEYTRSSPQMRAAEIYREQLSRAASASTSFEGEVAGLGGNAIGLQMQDTAISNALDRILEGEAGAASKDSGGGVGREGLNAVVREAEDQILERADHEERMFELLGIALMPVALLVLLLLSLVVGWLYYR